MDEYIKRETAIKALSYYTIENPAPGDIIPAVLATARNVIRRIDAEDVAPVVRGHWKTKGHAIVCSVCAEPYFYQATKFPRYKYCPCCGSKMEG